MDCAEICICIPERIDKLVLIASAGIVATKASFVIKTILYLMMGKKGREAISRMIFGVDEIPEEVLSFTKLVGENFNPMTGALPPLTDAQLSRLTMPLLYIAGENDATADVPKAAKRLIGFVPEAEIHVIKNNGHVIYDAMKWTIPFLA